MVGVSSPNLNKEGFILRSENVFFQLSLHCASERYSPNQELSTQQIPAAVKAHLEHQLQPQLQRRLHPNPPAAQQLRIQKRRLVAQLQLLPPRQQAAPPQSH